MPHSNEQTPTHLMISSAANTIAKYDEHELKEMEIRIDDFIKAFGYLMIYKPFRQSGLEPVINFSEPLEYWERLSLLEEVLNLVRTIRMMKR